MAFVSALACGSACRSDQQQAVAASAEVYIDSYCEDRIAGCDACAPVPENWSAQRELDSCLDEQWERHEEEPCFQLLDEFDRCRFERLPCDEYFAMVIDTQPGSPSSFVCPSASTRTTAESTSGR